jgi:tetratricopeptide (TPR) repeat protein
LSLKPNLLSIVALARSGALDRAWRLFEEAGLAQVHDDPAVLSVLGRLLKDRALGADGVERQRLYLESAGAYARAGEIRGAAYPLINAATLSLLAGRPEQARALARKVLERSEHQRDEIETPYYQAATRAEALLLLGKAAQAKKAFAEAISLAPRAYEDHASTLRQFGLILDTRGEDKAWLDSHRPPRSLCFAGHMALAAKGGSIASRIRRVLKEERIGFAYGALAAGADILIAEALLEAGAELHLILPAPKARFREISVARFGANWVARFDRIVETAYAVRPIANEADPASPLAIRLAAEVAMGSAVMQADVLMTEAVQLLILDGHARAAQSKSGSGWMATLWKKSGRRQHILVASRVRSRSTERVSKRGAPDCLAAMLRIDLSGVSARGQQMNILKRLARGLSAGPKPLMAPCWTGGAVAVAFDGVATAARAALSAIAALDDCAELRIAGHYAIVQPEKDPFTGALILVGAATTIPSRIALSTPSGAIHVTEDFVAALRAAQARERSRSEYVGELPTEDVEDPIRLFSLKR